MSKTNKMAGINNLRSCNVQSKPLYLAIFSAIEESLAFMGRVASCEKPVQLATQTAVSNKTTRFVLNECGKWVAAK